MKKIIQYVIIVLAVTIYENSARATSFRCMREDCLKVESEYRHLRTIVEQNTQFQEELSSLLKVYMYYSNKIKAEMDSRSIQKEMYIRGLLKLVSKTSHSMVPQVQFQQEIYVSTSKLMEAKSIEGKIEHQDVVDSSKILNEHILALKKKDNAFLKSKEEVISFMEQEILSSLLMSLENAIFILSELNESLVNKLSEDQVLLKVKYQEFIRPAVEFDREQRCKRSLTCIGKLFGNKKN